MKFLKTCFLLPVFFLSAGHLLTQWTPVESPQGYINFMKFEGNSTTTMLMGVNSMPIDLYSPEPAFPINGNGFMRYNVNTSTEEKVFLNDKLILDVYKSKLDEQKWYVATRDLGLGQILASSDGGESWLPETYCLSSVQILRINSVVNDGNERFFGVAPNTSTGLYFSDDEFATCESYDINVYARQIKTSKLNPDKVLMVGDHRSQGRLYISEDRGETWDVLLTDWINKRVSAVQPSSADENVIFVGVDSVTIQGEIKGMGIYVTRDGGETWKYSGALGHSVYQIEEHPTDPERLAAACGNGGVFYTDNVGLWWEVENSGMPENYDIRNIAIPDVEPQGNRLTVYANSYGTGIFRSDLLMSLEEPGNTRTGLSINSVYPNPAVNNFNMEWNQESGEYCQISLVDVLGNVVTEFDEAFFSAGENVLNLELPSNIPSGMYLVRIKSNSGTATAKINIGK